MPAGYHSCVDRAIPNASPTIWRAVRASFVRCIAASTPDRRGANGALTELGFRMRETLRPGDSIPVPAGMRCTSSSYPYADRTTVERIHLYLTCRGGRYFVGQVVGQMPSPPTSTD